MNIFLLSQSKRQLVRPIVALVVALSVSATSDRSPAAAQESVVRKTGLSAAEFQKVFDKRVAMGWAPEDLDVSVSRGMAKFEVLFRKPKSPYRWAIHHQLTDKQFAAKSNEYSEQGLKLQKHKTFRVGRQRFHLGRWTEDARQLSDFWRPDAKVPVTGKAIPGLHPFDQLMTRFLKENQLPGATLAISRNGRLIYSRGFGFRDLKNQQQTTPGTLMRIASVSKPLTAVAIFRLVEQNKLKLDDPILKHLRIRPYQPNGNIDERLSKITIRHCLQHTAGWDRDKSYDPMFRPKTIAKALSVPCPPGPANIIRYMLNQPLDHPPGTQYAYSNFGYNVLGRIIETASGIPYEEFVRREILQPLDISSMRIGRTLISQRGTDETLYYPKTDAKRRAVVGNLDEFVYVPYGAWHVEAMDAHGGWIATAEDLVRFAAALDKPRQSKILTVASVQQMFARPPGKPWLNKDGSPKSYHYGCGWLVRPVGTKQNTWHNGLLDGTSTLLVRRHDGLNWAVLFNKSHCADGKTASSKIDPLLHQAARKVKKWPR